MGAVSSVGVTVADEAGEISSGARAKSSLKTLIGVVSDNLDTADRCDVCRDGGMGGMLCLIGCCSAMMSTASLCASPIAGG